ncbi:hypothetical protein ACDL62_10210 [Corynebacterium diphtheriae]|uniref:hypothetical protein n=1 Tax=Corynebacterium diphtheriae TaxID=1717 RepID=UPI00089302AE|nr:hypothetical protein [Corynebacterium diphtheriae]MBG9336948.1 hypothetical protein [Corynebacterium diphtheriae bv. gravis]OFI53618.1 hypothetical protein BKD82_03590 [Corynebacterium diphtheriae]OFI62947.1 hypothetical protein BKD87_03585 [Corynebacterium diphtheriae]OSQ18836.1 hypothetical protein B1A54_06180 [Corynebacterium diphtheriae]CAB0541182.1 hypothetical protein CIP107532_00118 [Corynebacterium diphtheriae]
MRHSPEQFHETMNKLAEPVQFALTQGIKKARKSNLGAFRANKSSLLSHIVRSGAYDYLHDNPVEGFTLVESAHNLNQAVCLHEEDTGLEIRLAKLKRLTLVESSIPQLDEDPVIQQQLALYELEMQTPGLAFISWEKPKSADSYNFNLLAIRQSRKGNIRKGEADLAIQLSPGQSEMIPKTSFDPNAIYNYELEDEKNEDFS